MPPAPNDNRTDLQLVEALNSGDTSAFDALYFRHRDWVVRLAERFTGHHDDALDVLQETFAYLARKFPGFALTSTLTTFLYPAVRNYSIAARRKRQRAVNDNQDALAFIPGNPESQSRATNDLPRTLSALSESHREILLMRFVDDMTQPEIAVALDIPLGTVKSRLHHALLAIKQSPEMLERLVGDY
jgi:RNA polymerase sigma-70 factor (ECF subfamily)